MSRTNPHVGSTLESWLKEEGTYESATAKARTTVIAAWLQDWFAEHGRFKPECDQDYYDVGAVDSLSYIELLEATEKHFGFKFGALDGQDRRIQTIAGLSQIINEHLQQG